MVKRNYKKAFSFAEILISMLILSVFFIAGAKIFTHKQKDEVMKKINGFYECYWTDGGLMFAMSKTGKRADPKPAAGTSCLFTTAKNNSLFEITILFPNNAGIIYDQQMVNAEWIQISPPVGDGPACFTTSDKSEFCYTSQDEEVITIEDNPENEDTAFTYDMVLNNLDITSHRSNILRERRGGNQLGAVLINW